MGEDGPKGDIGEKVRTFHLPSLRLGNSTEKYQTLSVALQHKEVIGEETE